MTEAGGVANGTAGTPTATGDLDATDVDNPADAWQAVAAGAASDERLRHLRADARRACGPTRSTTAMPAVQALNGAATLTDTFTALTADGTAQVVTITIHAQNDAAVITGDATGDVTEAGGVANGTPGDADRHRRPRCDRRRQSGRRLAGGGRRRRERRTATAPTR